MSQFSEQRVALLVDIQNLYYSARVLHGKKVSFKNMMDAAVGDRKLIRSLAYGITTVEGMEEKFFNALEKSGFEVKTKDLQIFPGGAKKGDWDVGIAVDAIKLAPHVDVIIIASGDGDFRPLVQYIQHSSGCRVEGIAFEESTSHLLLDVLDGFTNMSADKRRFLIS